VFHSKLNNILRFLSYLWHKAHLWTIFGENQFKCNKSSKYLFLGTISYFAYPPLYQINYNMYCQITFLLVHLLNILVASLLLTQYFGGFVTYPISWRHCYLPSILAASFFNCSRAPANGICSISCCRGFINSWYKGSVRNIRRASASGGVFHRDLTRWAWLARICK
jgi:hypothetical protein